jgi:hypothetical protein
MSDDEGPRGKSVDIDLSAIGTGLETLEAQPLKRVKPDPILAVGGCGFRMALGLSRKTVCPSAQGWLGFRSLLRERIRKAGSFLKSQDLGKMR